MSASSAPLTALVAGHSPSDLSTVRDALTRIGIDRVEVAADGKAALAALSAGPPHLLVVDWEIAGRPIHEVVEAARASEAAPKVLLTMTLPTRRSVETAKGLGVDSIVAKPFSPRTFMDRVPNLQASSQGSRQRHA